MQNIKILPKIYIKNQKRNSDNWN